MRTREDKARETVNLLKARCRIMGIAVTDLDDDGDLESDLDKALMLARALAFGWPSLRL